MAIKKSRNGIDMTGGLAPAKNILRVPPPCTTGAAKFLTQTGKKRTDPAAHLHTIPPAARPSTRVAPAQTHLSTNENIPGTSLPKTPLATLQITPHTTHSTLPETQPPPTKTSPPTLDVDHLPTPDTTKTKSPLPAPSQTDINHPQGTTQTDLKNVNRKNLGTNMPKTPKTQKKRNPNYGRPQNTMIPIKETLLTIDKTIIMSLMIMFCMQWYQRASLSKEVIMRRR
jgi:hypothetical protein